jgi:hypothetical protein
MLAFLASNWMWILAFGGMFFMHRGHGKGHHGGGGSGAGGCGGHNHEGGTTGPKAERDEHAGHQH